MTDQHNNLLPLAYKYEFIGEEDIEFFVSIKRHEHLDPKYWREIPMYTRAEPRPAEERPTSKPSLQVQVSEPVVTDNHRALLRKLSTMYDDYSDQKALDTMALFLPDQSAELERLRAELDNERLKSKYRMDLCYSMHESNKQLRERVKALEEGLNKARRVTTLKRVREVVKETLQPAKEESKG